MMREDEERILQQSVEKGEWRQVRDYGNEADRYKDAAKNTLRKDKRVNIRMTERDLVRLQKKAMDEGLPYQTLISSVLHKYIEGRLVEASD